MNAANSLIHCPSLTPQFSRAGTLSQEVLKDPMSSMGLLYYAETVAFFILVPKWLLLLQASYLPSSQKEGEKVKRQKGKESQESDYV